MKRQLGTWIAAGLAAVAGGGMAIVVSSAGADVPGGNVISNPNAETGAAANATTPAPPPSWATTVNFSQLTYSNSTFWGTSAPVPPGGGTAFFGGGTNSSLGTAAATQTVSLSTAAPEIDASRVTATLSGDLGGFGTSSDDMTVTASFLNAAAAQIGSLTIGPVTPNDRGGATGLRPRSASGPVAAGTRSVRLTMTSTDKTADFGIRGYADNLSLTLAAAPLPTVTTPPPGIAPPKLGESFLVGVVKGTVLVSVPPAGTARTAASVPGIKGRNFVPLLQIRNIPIGSLLDTRRGTVALATARDSSGKIQTGEFLSGVFQVLQSRKSSAKGLTELRMRGSSFKRCPKRGRHSSVGASIEAVAARHSRRIRRLRGRTTGGRFRTRGRYSAATVRGTDWTVSDRCDGTLTKVRRGKVAVRDFRRRKTITVRRGKSYLARARR